MISNGIKIKSQAVLSAVIFLCTFLPATSYGQHNNPTDSLDYGLDLYEDQRYKNAEKALLELVSSSAFRKLDSSQRSLVYSHIAYSKINRGKEKESLPYIEKAMAASKREFGERSLRYLHHMRTKAIAIYWTNDRRKAARVGKNMIKILERMGDDYRSEQADVRRMVTMMERSNMEEIEIPVDLSDFYTDCESINSMSYLASLDSTMHAYKLIGKDIKPKYKKAQYFKNAYLKNVRESSKERKSRLIFVPDDEHMDDWCVIYPQGNRVARIAIATSEDH